MQWFIDIIKEWVIAQGYATLTQVLAIATSVKNWVSDQNYATLAEVLEEIQGTRFLYRRTGLAQSIPSGGWHVVEFNYLVYDTETEWNAAGHRFIAKTSGYYRLSFSVGFRPPLGVDKRFVAGLTVNGDTKASQYIHSSHDSDLSCVGSLVYHLDVGDYVQVRASQNSGFNVPLDYNSYMVYLSINRLV